MRCPKDSSVRINDTEFQTTQIWLRTSEAESPREIRSKLPTQAGCLPRGSIGNDSGEETADRRARAQTTAPAPRRPARGHPRVSRDPPRRGLELTGQLHGRRRVSSARGRTEPPSRRPAPAPAGRSGSDSLAGPQPLSGLSKQQRPPTRHGKQSERPSPPAATATHKGHAAGEATAHSPSSRRRLCLRKRRRATRAL